jgi:transposase-like protein
LKQRDLKWIGLMIADGSLGLWNALRDIYPNAKRQRCFLNKMRNILDKVSASKHDEVLQALRQMYYAGSLEMHRSL